MRDTMTAFLRAAQERGCRFQVGSDMLFEQIPAYLEFFGWDSPTPELLRRLACLEPAPACAPSPTGASPALALANPSAGSALARRCSKMRG
jgi:shikimate dehydrogenase